MMWLLLGAALVYGATAQNEPARTEQSASAAVQELGMARLLASKFLLSQYAVEQKEFVVDYRIYNVGDVVATSVVLDDRANFPTTHYEIVRGLLQVRWERIAPGANVTHSVILRPRTFGSVNYTAALVSYLPTEEATEPRVARTTAPGESYVYRLRDYERKFSAHAADWAVFALMALPCLALPAWLWYATKRKYESADAKKSK